MMGISCCQLFLLLSGASLIAVDKIAAQENADSGFESNEEYQVVIDDTYSHAIAVSWKDPVVVSKFNMTAIPTDGLGRTATGLYTSEIPEVNREYTFTGLTPYTNYTVYVQPMSEDALVKPKKPVVAATGQYYPRKIGSLTVETTAYRLLVKWTEPTEPRGIIQEYSLIVEKGHVITDGVVLNLTVNSSVTEYNTTKVFRPYTDYTVKVRAKTEHPEWGEEDIAFVQTLETAPESWPPNAHYKDLTAYSVTFQWDEIPKEERNGKDTGYVIWIPRYSMTVYQKNTTFRTDRLVPNTKYYCYVSGYTNVPGKGPTKGASAYVRFTTLPATNVSEISFEKRQSWAVEDGITESKIQFRLTDDASDLFPLDNGPVTRYSILVVSNANKGAYFRKAGTEPFPIFNKLLTWKEAKDENFEKPYAIGEMRDAPTSWYLKSRRKRSSEGLLITIGDEDCDSFFKSLKYCNGPLLPENEYCVYIRGWTKSGIYYMDSDCVVIATPSKDNTAAIVAGVVVGAVVLIIAIIVICCCCCRKSKRKSNTNHPSFTFSQQSAGEKDGEAEHM